MLDNLTIQEVTLLVVGILVFLSFVMALISLFLETDRSRQWFGDWFQGLSTEMLGAAVTTIFFTFIVGTVEQQQAAVQLRQQLIERMGSSINTEALRAVEELGENGWLRDGSLQGSQLDGANLAGAILLEVNLENAILFDANLSSANLEFSSLRGAFLRSANLQNTNLRRAVLMGADLESANLRDADLTGADLRGARLPDANLEGAVLNNTLFDENTILPDAEFVYNADGTGAYQPNWTPQTDMSRFTDPSHPDFWRPVPPYPWWYDESD